MAARVTQQLVEVLSSGGGGALRVTRQVVEVLAQKQLEFFVEDTLNFQQFVNSAARVTQQVVEVIGSGFGNARVTRQMVEALAQATDFNISHDLGLVDSAGQQLHNVAGENILALTSAVHRIDTFNVVASNALALTDDAVGFAGYVSVVDTLAFTHEAFGDTLIIYRELAHDLGLAHDTQVTQTIHNVIVPDIAELEPGTGRYLRLEQTIFVSATQHVTAENVLGFSDATTPDKSINNQTAADAIIFSQNAARTFEVSASNALAFTDDAFRIFPFADILTFFDVASGALVKQVGNAVFFSDQVTITTVWDRNASHDISLDQAIAIVVVTVDVCNYRPQVGTSAGDTTPPSTTAPILTPSTLTLHHPFVSPTLIVILRNPEFGNRITLSMNRVNRKTRGGTKIVFRKSTWPKFVTLKIDISGLKQAQVTSFSSFLETTLGKEIGLTDHEGRIWRGIISTPDTEITCLNDKIPGCEDYATSFEFEGRLA